MAEPSRSSRLRFDGKINVQTLLYAVLLLIAVVASHVRTLDKIEGIEEAQDSYEIFQKAVDEKYVTQEYLEIVVIERIDRLDAKLERRLLELEQKLQEQLNRIEEKLDEF